MKPRTNGRTSTAKPKRVSMYELVYFVGLMKAFYTVGNTKHDTHFWQSIQTHCPNLMQAIDARFLDKWRAITFTRDIAPPESWGIPIDEEQEQHENSEEERPL